MFDPRIWAAVPFHFWSFIFFLFGSIVGSFLNVCIYRMPRGESIISPPSHCPSCGYSIPWYLNLPLVTWITLRGKCAHCRAPISVRYFVVELLTASLFLCCWLAFGRQSVLLALAYALLLSGLIAATFIDFEHFIIPDEITLGGIAAGFLASFLVPELHGPGVTTSFIALKQSAFGIGAGAGLVYAILRLGKVMFGRQRFEFPPGTRIVFTETSLKLPEQEIPYEEIFYRKSDAVVFEAETIELTDRCYAKVAIRLTPQVLQIGEEQYKPEEVPHMEAVTTELVLPREAMGLGDVKFMAAIGAFLGWQAVIFSLMLSSIIGAAVGIGLILLKKHAWSSRIPYGPYIAVAATVWMFARGPILRWLWGGLGG